MGQLHRVGLTESLIERVSSLPIHIHIVVYTLACLIPGLISILVAVIEVQELDEGSGKLSQLQLASVNLQSIQSSTREILILSDLIYASSETYLIDGTSSLANSTLESYRGIDFNGYIRDYDIQQYDAQLSKLLKGLNDLSYLDAIQLTERLHQVIAEYDQDSQQLVDTLLILNQSLAASLEEMTVRVNEDRRDFAASGILSLVAWVFYLYTFFGYI